ncbi:ATP-dependent zinc metalloprotease FtsH [Butyrivibrio sp. MC2013]|uniref:ATP-dependent zinc metalloprotease FtsH n=1 Tax=Butyrivibrio sp. MC2013 TaxID=1280686 RepID=UPI000416890F|nr:ATP-dependent zinc metalloprotease FtsH [Butyrivibrio sp. MC2013]
MENRRRSFGTIFGIIIVILLALVFLQWVEDSRSANNMAYTIGKLQRDLDQGRVTSAVILPNAGNDTGAVNITFSDADRGTETLYVTDVARVQQILSEGGIDAEVRDIPGDNWLFNWGLPILCVAIVLVMVMSVMSGPQGAGNASNNRMLNFGRSRAKMTVGDDNKVKLDDVAGLSEEKEQLAEIIEFLKNPEQFTKVGARIPKGVLLEGAPGTGKTLLARAIAGEAGVPFFSISGSDFVEMFVGVGASRVRDLFEDAKKNSPCIVFIDEIDAVARRRGTGMGGGHDEREQTLNQLLVEMDGFGVNEGIIVMAATNRVDILDPAILRPGRFDRKIAVARPDIKGREAILNVHARNKPLADDVNLGQVAKTTAGFTGADLENLLNEAAIGAAMKKSSFIVMEDIKAAFVRVAIGTEKKSHLITDEEKRITAFHEAGHAILFHVLPHVGPVYTVSVIPTGAGAAGYTMPLPEKDEMFLTKTKILEEIMVDLGGRIAEEIIFGDITTGASSDIQKATSMARSMVTRYGMSDKIGTVNYVENEDDVFIGYDLGHRHNHSELMSGEIDKEVRAIIDDCYKKAKDIILEHRDVLDKAAALLIEKEKITGQEFAALFEDGSEEIYSDMNTDPIFA